MALRYTGGLADNGTLDMYDAARGLAGFQRSLALTAYLILNGEIITQAPSLSGAEIISTTPEEGSWKVTAVILGGLFTVGTASKETPIGNMMYSAYDYVINSTLGFHVDYKKALGEQYAEYLHSKKITPEKFDSLMEKTESSISDIHRPIAASKTAGAAQLTAKIDENKAKQVGPLLTIETYHYLTTTIRHQHETTLQGVISSFNINTFKGRIFSFDDQRPVAFELSESVRDARTLVLITSSLRSNAASRFDRAAAITLTVRRYESSTGRLKSLIVTRVGAEPIS